MGETLLLLSVSAAVGFAPGPSGGIGAVSIPALARGGELW
jgi:hypothetical protein